MNTELASFRKEKNSSKVACEILDEKEVFKNYLSLYSREIRFPPVGTKKAMIHHFDVVGHPKNSFFFATAFPFHVVGDKMGEVTLLREYCQGPNEMMYVLPTGGFDINKHSDLLSCAKAELHEEAQLEGGDWVSLLPKNHPGIAEVKWCLNRFVPYLCLNPQVSTIHVKQDEEEYIEQERVSIENLKKIMVSGSMLLPSVSTCFMALEKLKELGYL